MKSQQRRGDLELLELLNREREWETKARLPWTDGRKHFTRGIRNGLLIVTPIWLAFGRIMGWW